MEAVTKGQLMEGVVERVGASAVIVKLLPDGATGLLPYSKVSHQEAVLEQLQGLFMPGETIKVGAPAECMHVLYVRFTALYPIDKLAASIVCCAASGILHGYVVFGMIVVTSGMPQSAPSPTHGDRHSAHLQHVDACIMLHSWL